MTQLRGSWSAPPCPAALLLGAALLASPTRALAEETPPPAPALPTVAERAALRQKAGEHYTRGRELIVKKGACKPLAPPALSFEALNEMLESARLISRPGTRLFAAECHKSLGHLDEALDQFAAVLAALPDAPGDRDEYKTAAQTGVTELRPFVGSLLVEESEPGASIVIDGRARGEYPTPAPLNVSKGLHQVEVYRSGFGAFSGAVEITAGDLTKVSARLPRLGHAGRLQVKEQTGKVVEVILDGTDVGRTPWEGPAAEGKHTLVLRGEGESGTQPAPVEVVRDKLATATLAVEALDAGLRVVPDPSGSTVEIDDAFLGRGAYQGRFRPGHHTIRVLADGFVAATREVTLAKGSEGVVPVTLKRDPASPRWRTPNRFTEEVEGGVPLSPTFGGGVAGQCGGACSKGPAFGGLAAFKGGYELSGGAGFGVALGYLGMSQTTSNRTTTLQPVGFAMADHATATDAVGLRGFLGGVWGGYKFGERFPLRLRLGAGGLFGVVSDKRTGTFTPQNVSKTEAKTTPGFGAVEVTDSAAWLYLEPEVRFGVRLGDHVELSAGVEVLTLFTVRAPTWDKNTLVSSAMDGAGTFNADPITSQVLVVVTPGLAARYDF